ncbi:RNA polymerase sigma factor [Paenibacillus segetis]|uniref:DNA-directed RNA polymerase sigma-70 factor n=1 Tax=Paenibacillus segetis TaxID=1325360 RepID=A0ABQ1YUZ9_9BACL|nr:sigma-70 family RNA polymerase sigma factor [Paenibacillus segetis]GGH37557.1 DNA-directed RNA polymerase sigma-70 factor [Paenibacillus segetis]
MHENFMSIYDQYFDDVYRFVLFKTGDRWVTDDLVSEIFRKVFQRLDTVGAVEPDQWKPWLMTISRNTVIDYYRRKKDYPYGHDPEVLGYSQVQLSFTVSDPRNDCLEQSLRALTPEEREIMNLKYVVGLKYVEIGEMLGKEESWLKVKAHRIKGKMATFINRCIGGGER